MREGGSPIRQPNQRVTLRIFLRGAAEALRLRLASDPNIELVDRIEQAEAVLSLPPTFARDDDGGLRGKPARDYAAPVEALTTREHEVLALVADGLANRDIAARLGISDHTVKFHLASIFGKLGVSTRTEAVQRGLRLGVIDI
jgi:ATP/maltotriose-dependent transcriptional regulator MalT